MDQEFAAKVRIVKVKIDHDTDKSVIADSNYLGDWEEVSKGEKYVWVISVERNGKKDNSKNILDKKYDPSDTIDDQWLSEQIHGK